MKTLAMFLPQYHQNDENDTWWGEGFTEWTNVKSAKPLYQGHMQPRVPYQGLYYDLSDRNELDNQMKMASEYGIDGFCFYHYWFKGKKLLQKPLENMLKGEIRLPFCLCWANESWSRNWDGMAKVGELLMPQDYGVEDDWIEHFKYLNNFFSRKEYIKKDGKPVIVIYKESEIICRNEMYSKWRELAKREGYPDLYIISTSRRIVSCDIPMIADACMDFEPFATNARIHVADLYKISRLCEGKSRNYRVLDYDKFCQYMTRRYIAKGDVHYLGLFAGWDNTPRRGENTGLIFENNEPKIFGKYYDLQYQRSILCRNEFMFINAWNEWGEGTFLQPDEVYEFGYLSEIKRVKEKYDC